MAGGVGKGDLLLLAPVVAHGAEEAVTAGLLPVVADVEAVGVPIFVADFFALFFPGAQLPRVARRHVQPPDAVVHQMPRAFVAESEQVGLGRRCVDMAHPVVLLPHHIRAAAVHRHAQDATARLGLPRLIEAHVAAQQVHRKAVRQILGDAGADVAPVRRRVDHGDVPAVGHCVERARRQRGQVQRHQLVAVPEVRLVGHRAHARAQELHLTRQGQRRQVGQLGDDAGGQFQAVEIGPILPVGRKEQPAVVVIPAGIGKIEVVAVPLVAGQLAHGDAGEAVGIGMPFSRKLCSDAHGEPGPFVPAAAQIRSTVPVGG